MIEVEYPIVSLLFHDIKGYGLTVYSYYKIEGFLNEVRNYTILLDKWVDAAKKRKIIHHSIQLPYGLPECKYLNAYTFRTNLFLKCTTVPNGIKTYSKEYRPSINTIKRIKWLLSDVDKLNSNSSLATVYDTLSDTECDGNTTPNYTRLQYKINAMDVKDWYVENRFYKSYEIPIEQDWVEHISDDPSFKSRITTIFHIKSRLFDENGTTIGEVWDVHNLKYDPKNRSIITTIKYNGDPTVISNDVKMGKAKLFRSKVHEVDEVNMDDVTPKVSINTTNIEMDENRVSYDDNKINNSIQNLKKIQYIEDNNFSVKDTISLLNVPIGHAYGDVLVDRDKNYMCISQGFIMGISRLSLCCVNNRCYLNHL
jgi:hypothetical protein